MSIPLVAMEVWLGDQSHEIRTKADLETALCEVDSIINKDKPVLFKFVPPRRVLGSGSLC